MGGKKEPERDRGEDVAKALIWRLDEKHRRRREFRATPPLHTTVCVGHRQRSCPGDRAVCLLIISGQDEPSAVAAAATGDRVLRVCVYVCRSA